MLQNELKKPNLGFGLGLRPEHYETILSERPPVDWFEILTENYLVPGGKPHYFLEKIRKEGKIAISQLGCLRIARRIKSCDYIIKLFFIT